MNSKNFCPHCKKNNLLLRESSPQGEYEFLVPDINSSIREWIDCLNCNLCFSTPRLSQKQLDFMYMNYRSEEFRGETADEYFDRITNYPPEKSENFQKLIWITGKIQKNFAPHKILDIGSGGGVLIHTLGKFFSNAELFGIEPTANFAELSQRRTKAQITNGYFNSTAFEDHSFDLITCCQVLEHIENLTDFAKDVYSKINKGGYFYLDVPDISDFDTLEKNHSRFLEPSHLWYFNSEFLCKKLFKNYFSLIEYTVNKTVRGRNNLMILFKKK